MDGPIAAAVRAIMCFVTFLCATFQESHPPWGHALMSRALSKKTSWVRTSRDGGGSRRRGRRSYWRLLLRRFQLGVMLGQAMQIIARGKDAYGQLVATRLSGFQPLRRQRVCVVLLAIE